MKVLVVGASAGSGLATTQALLAHGAEVTALARRPGPLPAQPGRLTWCQGDATCAADLDRAMPGQQAVVVTLGIRESALRVRLLGSAHTPMDVRSRGTQAVIDAMRRHGVPRLVVQTSFGVGPTRDRLPRLARLVFALLLKPQIQDTERQEQAVRASGLDWVLVQPVNLRDEPDVGPAFASPQGDFRSMKVTRRQVGEFLAATALNGGHSGATVALSAEPAAARCRAVRRGPSQPAPASVASPSAPDSANTWAFTASRASR